MNESQICTDYLGRFSLKLDPRYSLDNYILTKGLWERHIVEFIQFFVKPGHVCIDVGANAGYHTLLMASLAGEGGQVYAFEPNNLVYPKLRENLALNPELSQIVQCENVALSEEPGELKVFQSGDSLGNAYVSKEYNEKLWNSGTASDFQSCRVIRLDDYPLQRRVDFMKIDVEGMELEVLRGARNLLSSDHPTIIYETLVKTFDKEKLQLTQELLYEHGYLLFGTNLKFGKLVPTGFPYLQEDTIALHRTRIVDAAEAMLSAARYCPVDGMALGIKEVVAVGDSDSNLYVKATTSSGDLVRWHSVPLQEDSHSFVLSPANASSSGTALAAELSVSFRGNEGAELVICRGTETQSMVRNGGRLLFG